MQFGYLLVYQKIAFFHGKLHIFCISPPNIAISMQFLHMKPDMQPDMHFFLFASFCHFFPICICSLICSFFEKNCISGCISGCICKNCIEIAIFGGDMQKICRKYAVSHGKMQFFDKLANSQTAYQNCIFFLRIFL